MKTNTARISMMLFLALSIGAFGCGGDDDGNNQNPTATPTLVANTPTATSTSTLTPTSTATSTPTNTPTPTQTPTETPEPPEEITLRFQGRVGDAVFECGAEYEGIGTTQGTFIPTDFRFYVFDVRLVTADGSEVPLTLDQDYQPWQLDDIALLDFEDGCSNGSADLNHTVRGTAPHGEYTGVKFVMGVPFDLNHGDQATAPDPLSFGAMFWSWQAGYKFIRMDSVNLSAQAFLVHLGSTGCEGSPPQTPVTSCARPNRVSVEFADFDPHSDVIVADLAALLADSDINFNTPETLPGCQASPTDPDCDAIFAKFGLNLVDGTSDPAAQEFFRVEHGPIGGHIEVAIGSDAAGGGQLAGHFEFDAERPVALFFSECLGGTGDDCEGGMVLYSAGNPGLSALETDDPKESLYTLAEGVPVTLEVTAIDEDLSVRIGEATLDEPGHSVVLGEAPEFHADALTQLITAGGGLPMHALSFSFVLRTSAAEYTQSNELTIRFVAVDDDHAHGDDDDHERM